MHTLVHRNAEYSLKRVRCSQRSQWVSAWDRMTRSSLFLAVLALFFWQGTALAQVVRNLRAKPAWDLPVAGSRLVVEKETNDFFLVQVPAQLESNVVAGIRAFATTNEVASRVVWRDATLLTVLVDAREARKRQVLKIYPVPGEKPVEVVPRGLLDPTPLYGTARRTAGMDYPASLADIGMLETRCDGKAYDFSVRTFTQLGETFKDWNRGDWTRKSHLVELRTWLLVPEEGRFVFGLAGVAPAWLQVDGQEVLAHPADQPFDAWTAGDEVVLSAGLRRIEIRTVCRQQIDTGLAWKRAGEPGIATNVVMITGGDLRKGRWERREQILHPYGTAESLQAYRFRGMDDLFIPFQLKDQSACWGTNYWATWTMGAHHQPLGGGETLSVTLRKSQLPSSLWLQVRAASGEEAEYEMPLAYDGPVWDEYEVSTRVTDVPAVCYADDRVHPIIRIRTSAPDQLSYELISERVALDGQRTRRQDTVTPDKGWVRVYLESFEVSSISNVTWTLQHGGVTLSSGELRFQREPHQHLPDAVSGGLFKEGAAFVVLVASRAAREQLVEPVESGAALQKVAILDGFLFGSDPHNRDDDSGQSFETNRIWQVTNLQAIEQTDDASGTTLLLPFVAIREVLPADVVILAPSLLSISREGGTAGFERRLAAMASLLASPACGQPRVLLVVPPAFDVLPGCGCVVGEHACVHAAKARDYATLVVRVADALGLETVDLFTAFMTSEESDPLIRNGALTCHGRAFARYLIQERLSRLSFTPDL